MSIHEPPPEFWRAILDIHNRLFTPLLTHYHMSGRPEDHVFRSFQTVDAWLDQAIERGWMNDGIVLIEK
jgi:hypothetical protein